jgi:hypothetical protein
MPISETVDHARHRVLARVTSPLTVDQISAHLDRERSGSGLPYPELMDARGFRPTFSSPEVRHIVQIIREFAKATPFGPTAVVIDTDVGYGVLRMVQMLVDDVCVIHPFREQDEAERWLAKA